MPSVCTIFATDSMRCDFYSNEIKSDVLVLNFTQMGPEGRDIENQTAGRGGSFMLSLGCDVISISESNNHSYQDLTETQITQISSFVEMTRKNYKKVVGHGSSMGGFAAILFSNRLKLDEVLAFSPYYDIRFPWEPRWAGVAKEIKEWNNSMTPECIYDGCKYLFYYDPKDLDLIHINYYKSIIKPENLLEGKITYSGHPCVYILKEASLLKDAVKSFIKDGTILNNNQIKMAKKGTNTYLRLLSDACKKRGKSVLANKIYNKQPEDDDDLVSLHLLDKKRLALKKPTRDDVVCAYKMILGREPEDEQIVLAQINHHPTVFDMRDGFLKSEEFNAHQKIRMETNVDKDVYSAENIATHLNKMLTIGTKKSLNFKEFCSFAAQDLTIGEIAAQVKRTTDGENKNVLIFGAFGNGNIGDAYQAVAVAERLMAVGVESKQIFACSEIDISDFPFPKGQIVSNSHLYDMSILETYGALIIGGGGLFSHPHSPINIKEWAATVNIPILILGVGAENITQDYGYIIESALSVSGRDDESVSAMQKYRKSVTTMADPILATNKEALLRHDKLKKRLENVNYDCLWVLKYPMLKNDEEMLHFIKKYIAKQMKMTKKIHKIVAIEPKNDTALEEFFPDILGWYTVTYLTSASGLIYYIEASKQVITTRFHGAIFAAMCNKYVVGLSQRKIRAMLYEADIAGEYISTQNALVEAISRGENIDYIDNKQQLSHLQKSFDSKLYKDLILAGVIKK